MTMQIQAAIDPPIEADAHNFVFVDTEGFPHVYRIGGELICQQCRDDDGDTLHAVLADDEIDDLLGGRDFEDAIHCSTCNCVLGRVTERGGGHDDREDPIR